MEQPSKMPLWLKKTLQCVFFPVTLFKKFFGKISQKYRMTISSKTTLLNSVLFSIMLLLYAILVFANVIYSVNRNNYGGLVFRLMLLTLIIIPVYIAVFAAFCSLTSSSMLSPVRKMINKMDAMTAEDLSERLDPVDAQDELMELTNRINRLFDDIEQTFARQRNFVSDASHELRTPISVVQGYADLLARWGKNDPDILDESITAIQSESANMKTIVEQLLYLAKLGSFKPSMRDFDLTEAVGEVVEAYGATDVKREISFVTEPSVSICSDRSLVVELVRIITDNAIKYTEDGGKVSVKVSQAGGFAVVAVADNGRGISAEDLPHVFDRFYRCDKARGRESGSTGLGLAIARSIATMMGGTVDVASTLGVGSEFTIRLPL